MEKIEVKSRKRPQMERRPATMLKDFLRDDLSSCSSSGFRSFPRRSCYSSSVRSLLEKDLKANDHDPKNSRKLLRRTRSESASTTVSALQKASEVVMNVMKHFRFPSVKSSFGAKQGSLARNLSRKLRRSFTKRSSSKEKREITVVVKVKDIVRWKSFRDLVEEKQKPVINRFSVLPVHPTTTATTITTAGHSWSDCDFTSEYLHSSSSSSDYSGENEVDDDKEELTAEKTKQISKDGGKGVAGEDSMGKGPHRYEKDQFSPVSVHDFPSEEDEETPSSFQSSLDKMERIKQKLMQKIRRFESLCELEPVDLEKRIASFELHDAVLECPSDSFSINDIEIDDQISEGENVESVLVAELKARNLLELLIDGNASSEDSCQETTGSLLVDFFTERITEESLFSKRTPIDDGESDEELLREAREWMNGQCETLDMRLEESREVHIREMEKGLRWNKFEVEQEELALEVESAVLGSLMNELLHDLLSN